MYQFGSGKDTIYEAAGGHDIIEIRAGNMFQDLSFNASNIIADRTDSLVGGQDVVLDIVIGGKSYGQITIDDFQAKDVDTLKLFNADGVGYQSIDPQALYDTSGTAHQDYATADTSDRMAKFMDMMMDYMDAQAPYVPAGGSGELSHTAVQADTFQTASENQSVDPTQPTQSTG